MNRDVNHVHGLRSLEVAREPNALDNKCYCRLRFLKTIDIAHVSRYSLFDLNQAIEEVGGDPIFNAQSKMETFISKVVSRLRLARNLRRSPKGPVFVALMGYSEYRVVPFAYWTELIPYCFDCWEPEYETWKAFFLRHRIRLAFFSARQSAQYFANALPAMRSLWLPEATNPAKYHAERKLSKRDIDVLELGRKHDRFHAAIVDAMIARKRLHLFERVKGEIIFADKTSFTDGLGRSKISVCFPCSQTHIQRSGSVETVTHRYFESIASKCVVLGHCPIELSDLFGYNPVIEVEAGKEVEQIESILCAPDTFQDLVDRNYERLLEVGTWAHRASVITEAAGRLASCIVPQQLPQPQGHRLRN
jgi:hypothetical protein